MEDIMRLRNIPGAQDAILESPYVIQSLRAIKEAGKMFLRKNSRSI